MGMDWSLREVLPAFQKKRKICFHRALPNGKYTFEATGIGAPVLM